MKANRNHSQCWALHITLNGEDMVSDGFCLAGDEEAGEVLMNVKRGDSPAVAIDASPGALVCDDLEVAILTGDVKITFNSGSIPPITDFEYKPLEIRQLDPNGEPGPVIREF